MDLELLTLGLSRWVQVNKRLINISLLVEETNTARSTIQKVLNEETVFGPAHYEKIFPFLAKFYKVTQDDLLDLVKPKAKIIAIWNQKGGVGKSTCSNHICGQLVAKGKKVLLIDSDYQGNTTRNFSISKEDSPHDLFDVLTKQIDIRDAIVPAKYVSGLDILPSYGKMVEFETTPILTVNEKIRSYEEPIQSVSRDYDFIIFDMRPTMRDCHSDPIFLVAEYMFMVMNPSSMSWDGYIMAQEYLRRCYRDNMNLKFGGAFFNRIRSNVQYEIDSMLAVASAIEKDGTYVFENGIKESVGAKKSFELYFRDTSSFCNAFENGEIEGINKGQVKAIFDMNGDFSELTEEILAVINKYENENQ
ncbi:ParA family protein [Persicobacter diffluens]|uniref:AAA domain-containing protein n=1 Tax=Persicobacter diffluens TaxID=981 RepID=A0AAN4W649_9BACT|nr:hypothetical protein PEDI_55940 [Persicobacter diffluens]